MTQKKDSSNKSKPAKAKGASPEPRSAPVLRFSPTAWAKLIFFRDRGDTEIGGFAVTSPEDLLYVEQFVTVKQEASVASIAFDDEAVADFFDQQVDAGRKPEQFARVWLHSHPGDSPKPSSVDEATFRRVFGGCDWAVMFIVAQDGATYARLRFNVGPGGQVDIPVAVDYGQPFSASNRDAWEAEYQANVTASGLCLLTGWDMPDWDDMTEPEGMEDLSVPDDWLEDLESMDPAESQFILAELAGHTQTLESEEFDEF